MICVVHMCFAPLVLLLAASSAVGREVLPHLPDTKLTRIPDLVNQPFVPRDFLLPERATIADVTADNGPDIVNALRNVLNRDAAATNKSFDRLSIRYLGKEQVGDNDTRLFVKTFVTLCTLDDDTDDDNVDNVNRRCDFKECNIELAEQNESADFIDSQNIALANLMCREARGCLACRENECPVIDTLGQLNEHVDLGLDACMSERAICTSSYTEVAGIRSYTHMGCVDNSDDSNTFTVGCRTDMHNYSFECHCKGSLCNEVEVVAASSLTESILMMRQLRAHIDAALQEVSKCHQGDSDE